MQTTATTNYIRTGTGIIMVDVGKRLFSEPHVNLILQRTDGREAMQLWMHLTEGEVKMLIEMLEAARKEM